MSDVVLLALILLLTEHLQQLLKERDGIIVLDQAEQEACVNKIILSHELWRHVFVQVQVLEVDIVGQQMFGRCLVESNIETVQALGFWVVVGGIK